MPRINILALDVGDQRVGVAVAYADVRVPVRLPTLTRQSANFWQDLEQVIGQYDIKRIVVGLPRGLDGQETAQTKNAQAFVLELGAKIDIPVSWQDEALTSVKAEKILRQLGKPYEKSDIDALAASYILEDYLETKGLVT